MKKYYNEDSDFIFHKKSFVVNFIVVSVVILFLICLFMYEHVVSIRQIDINEIKTLSKEEGALFSIDNAEIKETIKGEVKFNINGWCIVKNKQSYPIELHVLLRNAKTNKVYQLPTTMVVRSDVTSSIGDGCDYDNSGFSVDITKNDSDMLKNNYEILILYGNDKDKYIIRTNYVF